MDTIIVVDNKKITLQWTLPGKLSQQLSQLIITRADNSRGPFTPVSTLKGSAITFTDEKPLTANYYRIKGITKSGKAIYSFPYFAQLIDSTPPQYLSDWRVRLTPWVLYLCNGLPIQKKTCVVIVYSGPTVTRKNLWK
ncbi:hypothetical protein [Chitinophaga pinensis]|uniref:Fibronectin type-III domain-containing protein n=1 Tax=Chitinophaga pinensis TaxID=79329 RepID=A0A5C6LJA8_9BACT|nr:hypothetical protein [Chitinophaga pinensis]TWV93688.1 hypothetical protein FEF09_26690 [Chitinophaga pinensis]